jgi:hypothetical protein
MTNYSGTELPWTGGGPWRILDDCPSPITHNTLNAARGVSYTRVTGRSRRQVVAKCICPGGRVAIKKDNELRRQRTIAANDRNGPAPVQRVAAGALVPEGVRMPDLSGGACQTPFGRAVVDEALSKNGGAGKKAIKAAKDLCSFCPVAVAARCEKYVLEAESPPGSWFGVWAGMSQSDRRAHARRAAAQ